MAIPLTGRAAKITTTSSGTDLDYLFATAIRDTSATLNWEGSDIDVTAFDSSGVTMHSAITGLRSGTVDFEGLYPKSAPKLGVSGLVTYADGYVQRVKRWSIEIEFGDVDITQANGSAATFREFMPGGVGKWRGEYTGVAVDDTNVGMMSTANYAGGEATFKVCEDGVADPAWGGTNGGLIQIVGQSHPIRIGDQQEVTFRFRGTSTLYFTVGTNFKGLFAATSGAIARPSWDNGGSGTPTVVVQYASGRTYTGTAFWKSIRMESEVGQPIKVSGSLRWASTVTAA